MDENGMPGRGRVFAVAAVSVDGFVADEDDGVGSMFEWYGNGTEAVTLGDPDRVFHVSPASRDYLRRLQDATPVGIIGRRLFDLTDGWGGVPAGGRHTVVVTHRPATDWAHHGTAPFTFVGDLGEAVSTALAIADGGDVSITGGQLAGQALTLGLLDELHLNVTPVVMGRGRPFFAGFEGPEAVLGDPEVIVGERVIHTIYPVRR